MNKTGFGFSFSYVSIKRSWSSFLFFFLKTQLNASIIVLFTKGRTNLSATGNTHKKSDKIAMPAKILKVDINVATIIAIKEITILR